MSEVGTDSVTYLVWGRESRRWTFSHIVGGGWVPGPAFDGVTELINEKEDHPPS